MRAMDSRAQTFFKKILKVRIRQLKRNLKTRSDRGIAKMIGATSGELSEILSSKRAVSFEKAISLLQALETPKESINNLYRLSGVPFAISRHAPDHSITDDLDVKICALAESIHERVDAALISRLLNVDIVDARARLTRLSQENILRLDGKDYFVRIHPDIDLNQKLSASQAKKLKISSLTSAQIAIEKSDGIFLNLTFLGSSKKLKSHETEIINFLNSLSTGLSQGTNDELIRVSVQVFPLAK